MGRVENLDDVWNLLLLRPEETLPQCLQDLLARAVCRNGRAWVPMQLLLLTFPGKNLELQIFAAAYGFSWEVAKDRSGLTFRLIPAESGDDADAPLIVNAAPPSPSPL